MKRLIFALCVVPAVLAQSVVVTGPKFDASTAEHTLPFRTIPTTVSLPTTGCTNGETIVVLAAYPNWNYVNSGTGTCVWTQQVGGGGGGTPGGSPGQIQFNSAGMFGGFTMSGDATVNTGTGVLTLATQVGLTPGACGDSTHVCRITTSAKGIVASQTPVAISGGGASIVPYAVNASCSVGTCSQTIPEATHGQGINPAVQCWSGALSGGSTQGSLTPCTVSKPNALGDVTVGWIAAAVGSIDVQASGPGPAGSGGSPGGGSGQTQYNNSGSFGGYTMNGDATINTGTGAITLATKNSGPGLCGDATHVCQITTDAQGRTTSQSAVAITGVTSVTGSSPVVSTGGTTPALSCPTCTRNPAALTSGAVLLGGGGQVAVAGNLAGYVTTNGSATTYLFSDVRSWGVTYSGGACTSNVHTGALAALNAGLKEIDIPSGCTWILPNAPWTANGFPVPANSVPAGIVVRGQNIMTSIVQTTSPRTDSMYVGPSTTLQNLNLVNASCGFQNPGTGYYVAENNIHNTLRSTAVVLGIQLIDPASHLQQVVTAGTTGSGTPLWNDSGGTTSDSGVTWQDKGFIQSSCATGYLNNSNYIYTGTVDVSGSTVTWKTGDQFVTNATGANWLYWGPTYGNAQLIFVINGNQYKVDSVADFKTLTLDAPAGTLSNATYYALQYMNNPELRNTAIYLNTLGPQDSNGIHIEGGSGDAIYSVTHSTAGVAFRGANYDSGGDILYLERHTNGYGVDIADNTGATAGRGLSYFSPVRTSGEMLALVHNTSAYYGDVMLIDMAHDTGSLTGSGIHMILASGTSDASFTGTGMLIEAAKSGGATATGNFFTGTYGGIVKFEVGVDGQANLLRLRGLTTASGGTEVILGAATDTNFLFDRDKAGGQMIFGYATPQAVGGSPSGVFQIYNHSGAGQKLMLEVNSAGTTGGADAVIMPNLPTSCTGQVTGTLWNNSSAVGVCP